MVLQSGEILRGTPQIATMTKGALYRIQGVKSRVLELGTMRVVSICQSAPAYPAHCIGHKRSEFDLCAPHWPLV